MLDSGQNMKSIQEWLGHASYSTTANLYTHLTAGVRACSRSIRKRIWV